MFMCNIIELFFYYIESQAECWTSKCNAFEFEFEFEIISSLYGLLFLHAMEYHNETNNQKKLFLFFARFSSKRYMYFWFVVYACMKVSV